MTFVACRQSSRVVVEADDKTWIRRMMSEQDMHQTPTHLASEVGGIPPGFRHGSN